jgi:hypothetical protein
MNYLQDIKDDWVLNKMNICLKGEPEADIKTLLFWIKSNYFKIMQQDRDIKKYKEAIEDFAEEHNYEVYLAFNDKDNLYVGSGLAGRHKHCTSGCSHVVELNKEILAGNKVETVIVADGLTKRNSLEIEKLNILLFKPLYNKKISKNIDSKIVSAFMNIVEENRKRSSASTNN